MRHEKDGWSAGEDTSGALRSSPQRNLSSEEGGVLGLGQEEGSGHSKCSGSGLLQNVFYRYKYSCQQTAYHFSSRLTVLGSANGSSGARRDCNLRAVSKSAVR